MAKLVKKYLFMKTENNGKKETAYSGIYEVTGITTDDGIKLKRPEGLAEAWTRILSKDNAIIYAGSIRYFISYDQLAAVRYWTDRGEVTILNKDIAFYSRTTIKYLKVFLETDETTEQIRRNSDYHQLRSNDFKEFTRGRGHGPVEG